MYSKWETLVLGQVKKKQHIMAILSTKQG